MLSLSYLAAGQRDRFDITMAFLSIPLLINTALTLNDGGGWVESLASLLGIKPYWSCPPPTAHASCHASLPTPMISLNVNVGLPHRSGLFQGVHWGWRDYSKGSQGKHITNFEPRNSARLVPALSTLHDMLRHHQVTSSSTQERSKCVSVRISLN